MKKNGVLLLILFCCFQKAMAGFTPITVTSGYNADIVANGVGSASTSATAFDVPNDFAFVSADYQHFAGDNAPDHALPSSGLINSVSTSGLSFQFASFTGNNALLLSSTTTTGTLNMSAANVGALHFLTASANGSSDFTATIHFSDATTQTSGTLTSNDWYGNSGYAMLGVGRVGVSGDNLDGDSNDPRIYEVTLLLDPANMAKTITSVSFTANESGSTTMAIMAVSKEDPCNGTPSITTTNSTMTSVCPGVSFTLALSSTATDPGVTFQWQTSPDNAVWTNVAVGGTGTTYTTTQTAATHYRCVVTCTASTQSTPSVSTLVSESPSNQCYCLPTYATGCSVSPTEFYDLNDVAINGENGTSINNTATGCSASNAYTDYTSSVSAVSLTPYTDYTLSIGTQSTGNPVLTAWVDLNDDAVFNDATERVGTTNGVQTTQMNINVPTGSVGTHRLRITSVFTNTTPITDPCGAYNSGETEDYLIDLLPTPTCIHPLNLTATTSNATDELFTWTAGAAGTTYDYAIDQEAGANPDAASVINNVSTNSVTVAAVIPGTTSYFHLRAHCSASDSSIWIVKPFTLASTCSNAVTVTVGSSVTASNSTYPDVTIPASSCGSGTDGSHHGMWYKVTPATSGVITFSTLGGTTFDSYLRVYTGSCGALTCQAFNDNYFGNGNNTQSFISLNAVANATYYVLFSGTNATDTGNFTFAVGTGPSNDEASNATSIALGSTCAGPYSNLGATASTGEPFPTCAAFSAMHPVWFKFVAEASGTAKISTDFTSGSVSDTRMALFSATDSSVYSTFSLISCDDDNGVTGNGNLSIIYATNLTPGATYYVEVDNGIVSSAEGTFCLTVEPITSSYISNAAVACAPFQTPVGFSNTYTGWVSLVDNNGGLIALVKNPAGGSPANYSGSYTVNGGAIRTDGTGRYYLNRNYFINNPGIATPVDLQLFFTQGEYAYLNGISQGTVPMSSLNVTKQEGAACTIDYSESAGAVSVLTQTSDSLLYGIGWIQVSTSSFSNFYLMGGTTPLAIKLATIEAVNQGSSNKVSWTTAAENTGDYFELERSADAKNFTFLAKIASNQKPSDYVYYDETPLANVNYYRLKMIDANGVAVYSKVVQATVSGSNNAFISVFPNPTGKVATVKVYGTANGQVTLTDVSGRVIYTATMSGNEMNVDMSSLANGFYLIRYADNNLNTVTKLNKQ